MKGKQQDKSAAEKYRLSQAKLLLLEYHAELEAAGVKICLEDEEQEARDGKTEKDGEE